MGELIKLLRALKKTAQNWLHHTARRALDCGGKRCRVCFVRHGSYDDCSPRPGMDSSVFPGWRGEMTVFAGLPFQSKIVCLPPVFAIGCSGLEMKIFIDGKYYDERDAKVSVFDHGLLYGDGIFEGIRAYYGRVFKLREHIDRLFYSAKAILLAIPMSRGPNHARGAGDLPEKQNPGRLRPAGGDARHGHPGPEPEKLQTSVGHHHRGQHPALSAGAVSEGHGHHHRAHDP